MLTRLLVLLSAVLTSAGACLAQTQPTFFKDTGQTYLTSQVISSDAAGHWAIPFTFQSWALDSTTGTYHEPRVWTAYSLADGSGLPFSDMPSHVFGGAFIGSSANVISFDSGTGAGTAVAVLPVNRGTLDETWGHFSDGQHTLTLYWGSAGQMIHDGQLPPATYEGTKSISFTCSRPDYELAVISNRSIWVGESSHFIIRAKEAKPYVRTFAISGQYPQYLIAPATIDIPANSLVAPGEFTILAAGTGRIYATLQGPPGATAVTATSPEIKANKGPIRYVPNGGTAASPLGSDFFATCVEGTASPGPEGDNSNDNVQTFCGKWRLDPPEPAPTNDDCRPPGLDHSSGFVFNTYCDPSFEFVCLISQQKKHFQVTKWAYDEAEEEKSRVPHMWDPVNGLHYMKRKCCHYFRTENVVTVNVYECQ